MLKLFSSFLYLSIIQLSLVSAEALIIDHTAVAAFESIPTTWLNRAKTCTIHFAHTSHGSQMICGMNWLMNNIDPIKYKVIWNNDWSKPIPSQTNPPALRIHDKGLQPRGYWDGDSGLNTTRAILAKGFYNASLFIFCSEISNYDSNYVKKYLAAMEKLENEFPSVRFVYSTGHRDQGIGSKEIANNALIRNYCIKKNKILFDFADIESYDPAGKYYPKENGSCTWCVAWCAKNPAQCQNLPTQCEIGSNTMCPHSHGFNCVIKGKCFWYMMARLSGWDGKYSILKR